MSIFEKPQSWRDAMQSVATAIDEHLDAEVFEITPVDLSQSKPNHPPVYDYGKTWRCRGMFELPAKDVKLRPPGEINRSPVVTVASRDPKAIISYVEQAGRAILQSYMIKRVRTGEVYEVTNACADGVSVTVFDLVQYGRHGKADRAKLPDPPPTKDEKPAPKPEPKKQGRRLPNGLIITDEGPQPKRKGSTK